MTREIKVLLPDNVTKQKYADIAHGAWMLLQVAGLADDPDAAIESDGKQSIRDLTDRWDAYADQAPWQRA
ncbi:MAG TPA: hypothetical protein VGJ45_28395 [Pseudonocardiaceae bacterium]|jgi:hypothetical protein